MTEWPEYLKANPGACACLILALLLGWWLGDLIKGKGGGS